MATNVTVNAAALAKGVLIVDFLWPYHPAPLPLQALFPDTYPFFRPMVFLRADRATWPSRHVSPIDGDICLLGRDTAQWQHRDGLRGLLESQLEGALTSTGPEDPQAEPAEVWWNTRPGALLDSYCLVDSDWDLGTAEEGWLEIAYATGSLAETPAGQTIRPFRAAILRVTDRDGHELARWQRPLPLELATTDRPHVRIRWHRLGETLQPGKDADVLELREGLFGSLGKPVPLDNIGKLARLFAFLHPIELAPGQFVSGWILGGEWGSAAQFKWESRNANSPKLQGKAATSQLPTRYVPILRAGAGDIAARVPATGVLQGKRIAVFGCGALGAPIALMLARNGAAGLNLVDHDVLEPGNSVRWPLGAPCWGRHKVFALASHMAHHMPGVEVRPFPRHLGGKMEGSDDQVIDDALKVDLVIDAMANFGASSMLWHACRDRNVPLIKVSATPTLEGGVVIAHRAGVGCGVCVMHSREDGAAAVPPGLDAPPSVQPVGCSERTFPGADYDLQELSLQAMRVAVALLGGKEIATPLYTLSLVDASGQPGPPQWQAQPLPPHAACCGSSGAW